VCSVGEGDSDYERSVCYIGRAREGVGVGVDRLAEPSIASRAVTRRGGVLVGGGAVGVVG
jgi:hypothetical protein